MASKTIQSLITDLGRQVGGSVRSDVLSDLARLAISKAIDHGPYYNYREELWQDLTGFAVVNPQDSKRFALVGRNVTVNPFSKQHLVFGMQATYDHIALYRPRIKDLEHGVAVDGTLSPLLTTLSFEVPVGLGRKVRCWYRRKVEMPADDVTIIQLDDAYMERSTKMFLHELLSSKQIGGDSTNHAYQATQLAKQLAALKRARQSVRVNNSLWRPE